MYRPKIHCKYHKDNPHLDQENLEDFKSHLTFYNKSILEYAEIAVLVVILGYIILRITLLFRLTQK